jgi:hypothetical protein
METTTVIISKINMQWFLNTEINKEDLETGKETKTIMSQNHRQVIEETLEGITEEREMIVGTKKGTEI